MKNNVDNNKENNNHQVIVVGSGWAGLSSSIRLKKNGFSVQLFEATRQLGGRARCTQYKGHILDNGQHILLGACQETLDLFNFLGMQEEDYLYRQPLKLDFLRVNKQLVNKQLVNNQLLTSLTTESQKLHIHPANLPAPLHLLFGFINARNIKLKDKFQLIKLFVKLRLKNYHIEEDCGLLQILQKYQQSQFLIHSFWEPLCLAVMNTPIKIASAKIFFNVLKFSFSGQKKHSDLLLFSTPLCDSLPKNAALFLQNQHLHENAFSTIYLNSAIDSILIEDSTVVGITSNHQQYHCSSLILATPLHITKKLLITHQQCLPIVKSLQQINYQPIYTIYLYYQQKFELPQTMSGILNGYSQWVFDKSFSQQKGLLAVIISGPGKHQKLSKEQLIKQVAEELNSIFSLPELDWAIVVKENRATINCSVRNNKLRPSNQTPIKGLYLAGDYTSTGYPSTIEGAVLSGKIAADLVIKKAAT